MKVSEILTEVDVGFEKFLKTSLTPASKSKKDLMSYFGSDEYNKLKKMGIRFLEKPDSWDQLDLESNPYHPVSQKEIDQAEKEIGVAFKIYTQDKIFGSGKGKSKDPNAKDGFWPLSDAKLPQEPVFIVHMRDGTRYLVDGTQANTYIRMWAKIE